MCEILYTIGDEQIRRTVTSFPCSIGRSSACDIVVKDPSVSARHATLVHENGGLVLKDEKSTNGMYADGTRVDRVEIAAVRNVRLGNVMMRFTPSPTAASTAPAAPTRDSEPDTDADADEPPAAENAKCFYRRNNQEEGPFTWDEFRQLAADGTLKRADLVWVDGYSAWLKAELIPALWKPLKNRRPPVPDKEHASEKHTRSPLPPTRHDGPAGRKAHPVTAPPLTTDASRSKQRGDITCPHCWHSFDVEDFLYIARHQGLVGDPVLGPESQQRFLPSKFTPEGNAIDSAGMSCPDMACPRCHLRIPQSASEQPPLFLSVVGAAASGKSFALTAMIWELRNKLSRSFAISFTDTDAINNQIINECEETLFLNSAPDELVALRKTELQGEFYNQVLLDGMMINLPKPFMFSIHPAEHHPHYQEVRGKMSRTLVMYDNAGEHFEPGMDSVDNPTTRHLLHSDMIFFLFDPTQDMRFRRRIEKDDPQLSQGARVQRQEILLTEMINRIKKYSGMRAGSKANKTLVIVVSKADVWLDMLKFEVPEEPWQWEPQFNTCALDVNMIKNVSFALRSVLERMCPELVSTAESFAGDVLYVPNSALGGSPELSSSTGMLGIRPKDIRPFWASAPMLYFFHERGFVPALPRKRVTEQIPEIVPIECKTYGDVVFVTLPGRKQPLQVPVYYMGTRLLCPETGVWFDMPARRNTRRTGGKKAPLPKK